MVWWTLKWVLVIWDEKKLYIFFNQSISSHDQFVFFFLIFFEKSLFLLFLLLIYKRLIVLEQSFS